MATPSRTEDGIPAELWASIGLTPSETATLQDLLKMGATPASAVAKATHQSRGRAYQTLRSLVERGLVREEPTDPIQYVAIPPAEILRMLAAASRRRVFELEALLEKARPADSAPPVASPPPPVRVSMLRGRRAVLSEALRMVDGANDQVMLAGGGQFALRLRQQRGFLLSLESAAARGIRVAIAALPPELGAPPSALFPGLKGPFVATLPWERPMRLNLLVTEAAVLVVAPEPDDDAPLHGDDVGIRVDGTAFAQTFATWFNSLVQPSTAARPAQPLATPAQVLQHVGDAQRGILVMGGAPWLEVPDAERLRGALSTAAGRSVPVRVVTDVETRSWRVARALLPECAVRVAQSVPVWATVVDETVAFVGVPSLNAEEPLSIRRTEDATEVRHLRGLFDQIWAQAVGVTR